MDFAVGFSNVYSSTATGKLELSASVGINGLQPVIFILRGISVSARSTVANGKRARNVAESHRGRPNDMPLAPLPVLGAPNTFHAGTGPSNTRAVPLFTEIAAKVNGSLKISGSCRSEKCDSAPVPSRQNMPAPIPPSGKAMRLRWSLS